MKKNINKKLKRKVKEFDIKEFILNTIANMIIWPTIIVEFIAVCSGEYVVAVCIILIATFILIALEKIKYAD